MKSYQTSARKPVCSAGFTLIELLVVIAIIAILAAILFPVFARAKAAAKASASISNAKQHALAVLGYAADYDDNFVISGQWHSADSDACTQAGCAPSPFMPWTGLTESYMKNRDINFSPFTTYTNAFDQAGSSFNRCSTQRQCGLLYPTYGYNAQYLSPADRNTGITSALSTTAVAKPAEQVMLTEIWSRNTTRWNAFGVGPDLYRISFGTSEAPDGATGYGSSWKTPYGVFSWGNYSNGLMQSYGLTREEGLETGGVAFRGPGGRTPVAFTDGHVKSMTDTQLATGTDWVRGTTFVASNLRNGKYLWDPRGV